MFAILEVIAVNWLYGMYFFLLGNNFLQYLKFLGIEQFCLDVEFMTKRKVGIYWKICWGILMPALLIVIFVYFIVTLKPLTYGIYVLEYPVGLTGGFAHNIHKKYLMIKYFSFWLGNCSLWIGPNSILVTILFLGSSRISGQTSKYRILDLDYFTIEIP